MQHPDIPSLLNFLAVELSKVVDTCAWHSIMFGTFSSGHDKVYRCSSPSISSRASEYKLIFTKSLHAQPGTVCYRCWCPQMTAFRNHPDGVSCVNATTFTNCDSFEDWWLVLCYLVFRVTALRTAVFEELEINVSTFGTSLELYAAWLTQHCSSNVDDNRITNMVIITHTYFSLLIAGRLALPVGGYKLDSEIFLFQINFHLIFSHSYNQSFFSGSPVLQICLVLMYLQAVDSYHLL